MQKITDVKTPKREQSQLVTGVPKHLPEIEGIERKAFGRKVVVKLNRLIERG